MKITFKIMGIAVFAAIVLNTVFLTGCSSPTDSPKPSNQNTGGQNPDTGSQDHGNPTPVVVDSLITSVSIGITAPVKGATPSTTANDNNETGKFTIGAVSWSPPDTPFKGGEIYTAAVTLTANSGYTFTELDSATMYEQSAEISNNTGAAVTLSYTFSATDTRTIEKIAIKTQPAKLTYTHGDTLDLTGLEVTLTYDDSTTENVAVADFTDEHITTKPEQGASLVHVTHDGKPVTIRCLESCTTSDLTVHKATPTADDFNIGNLTQIVGSVTAVTITPMPGKSNGARTIYYNGSPTLPTAAGTYAVTFDVATTENWNAATGLSAGTLTYNVFTTISSFRTWLSTQSANTATTAYTAKLNVSDLGGDYNTSGSVGNALYANNTKYVNLDLSGSTMTSIGNYAFGLCGNLTSVTIPNSVTYIDYYSSNAFGSCTNLITINVDTGNSVYSSQDGVLCDKSKNALFLCPQGKTGAFTIPNSVTSIGSRAFYDCQNITSIDIPDSVTSIGEYAFYNCYSLTSITIPNSVTSIRSYAFAYCTSLTSVTFVTPSKVTSIEYGAFIGCRSLTSIIIPDSVTTIGNDSFGSRVGAFESCSNLTNVTIGNNVTLIGYGTFRGCAKLASIAISNSVTNIEIYAFQKCTSLTNITIPNSVTHLGSWAFEYCTSLTSVTFQGTIDTFDARAFGTLEASGSTGYIGDLASKSYALGTPGTYTRPDTSSKTWSRVN